MGAENKKGKLNKYHARRLKVFFKRFQLFRDWKFSRKKNNNFSLKNSLGEINI